MSGNRFNKKEQQHPTPSFWSSLLPSSSSSSSSTSVDNDDSLEDALIASFANVSVSDTVRAVLTDTNSNFDDLCKNLNSQQISDYRTQTLKEADIVAARVERDLDNILRLHGPAKTGAEQEQRLMIVQVVQAYMRCLELDIDKWKRKLELMGKSESEIAGINITIRDFIPWKNRSASAPIYTDQPLEAPKGNTVVEQIAFIQLALNYWRSCYHYIRDYENLIGAEPESIEKELWRIEQVALSYLDATDNTRQPRDINNCRLREPTNINSITGKPLSIASIQALIQQQQERSGYTHNKKFVN